MAWIKYPYTIFPTRNGSFLAKPLLEIEISANGITNKQRAIVDSGADIVLLGQDDFFKNFRVKFEKDHNTFEISKAPKK